LNFEGRKGSHFRARALYAFGFSGFMAVRYLAVDMHNAQKVCREFSTRTSANA